MDRATRLLYFLQRLLFISVLIDARCWPSLSRENMCFDEFYGENTVLCGFFLK